MKTRIAKSALLAGTILGIAVVATPALAQDAQETNVSTGQDKGVSTTLSSRPESARKPRRMFPSR